GGGWRRARRRGARGAARLAVGIAEVAEEVRVGPEQQPGIVLPQPRLVGLHRAVEGKEVRILAKSLGEDAVAFGVAFAARLLGLGGGFRDQHGHVAVRAGTNLLAALRSLRAELGRLALALGLHALID